MIRHFALALALTLPAPVLAQDAASAAAPTAQDDALREAQEKGRQMAQVQRATALAQRQFAGMTGGDFSGGYQGAIALPGAQPDSWVAIIVGQRGDGADAPLVALGEYEIADGAIVSEVIHPIGTAPTLDGAASAMAQARSFAPRAVLAAGHREFCGDGADGGVNFVTIVLPPDENGRLDAYVLNGPVEDGAIPLGKHFRVGFDEFGLDGEPELITESCEVVTWQANDQALARQLYPTRHSGGTAPEALHVFLSTLIPMQLGVVVGDTLWPIADGTIGAPTRASTD